MNALKTTSAGTVKATLSFGGPQQARAVAKLALGFLALEIGDDVFTAPYAALRTAVVQGGDVRAWGQPPFRALAAPMLPPTDGVQHRILIYTTGSETWAHVEVYGTYGYAVLLAEILDARFTSPYVWGQNPTTGDAGEGQAPGTPLPTPVREHVTPAKEDHAGLFRAMKQVAFDTAYAAIIDEELALAFAGLGEGEEISEAFIDGLTRRIAERFTALRYPAARSTSLNRSRAETNSKGFDEPCSRWCGLGRSSPVTMAVLATLRIRPGTIEIRRAFTRAQHLAPVFDGSRRRSRRRDDRQISTDPCRRQHTASWRVASAGPRRCGRPSCACYTSRATRIPTTGPLSSKSATGVHSTRRSCGHTPMPRKVPTPHHLRARWTCQWNADDGPKPVAVMSVLGGLDVDYRRAA